MVLVFRFEIGYTLSQCFFCESQIHEVSVCTYFMYTRLVYTRIDIYSSQPMNSTSVVLKPLASSSGIVR